MHESQRPGAAASAPTRSQRLDRLPFTTEHRKLLVGSGVGWALDAMDVGLISFVMAALAQEWGLGSGELSLLASIGFVGMAVGASLGGLLADRLGRRQARRRAGGLAQLVEQPRLHRTRVEDGLEPARGQFLNLLRREIDAVALGDARFDLLDDVIDVGLLGLSLPLALILSLRRGSGSAVTPPVVTATAAMELWATPGLRMLVCCHVDR